MHYENGCSDIQLQETENLFLEECFFYINLDLNTKPELYYDLSRYYYSAFNKHRLLGHCASSWAPYLKKDSAIFLLKKFD